MERERANAIESADTLFWTVDDILTRILRVALTVWVLSWVLSSYTDWPVLFSFELAFAMLVLLVLDD